MNTATLFSPAICSWKTAFMPEMYLSTASPPSGGTSAMSATASFAPSTNSRASEKTRSMLRSASATDAMALSSLWSGRSLMFAAHSLTRTGTTFLMNISIIVFFEPNPRSTSVTPALPRSFTSAERILPSASLSNLTPNSPPSLASVFATDFSVVSTLMRSFAPATRPSSWHRRWRNSPSLLTMRWCGGRASASSAFFDVM